MGFETKGRLAKRLKVGDVIGSSGGRPAAKVVAITEGVNVTEVRYPVLLVTVQLPNGAQAQRSYKPNSLVVVETEVPDGRDTTSSPVSQ